MESLCESSSSSISTADACLSSTTSSNANYSPIHQFFFDVKVICFTCIVACIGLDVEADGRDKLAVGVRSNTGVPDVELNDLWIDCEGTRTC
jgi:hypothetical protein